MTERMGGSNKRKKMASIEGGGVPHRDDVFETEQAGWHGGFNRGWGGSPP